MDKSNRLNPATITARANGAVDHTSGGVVPPVSTSTTYIRNRSNELASGENSYIRDDSDTVRIAEDILMTLESAQDCMLLPSGMAATTSIMRQCKNGGKILLQSGIYWGTTKWTREFCARRNIELVEINCSDAQRLTQTIIEFAPDFVFIETPSNPWLEIVDISSAAIACKKVDAVLVVDSTAASPILTQPLALGADIVMHSATKVINGHSDVLAGVLCVKDNAMKLWQEVKTDRHDAGAIIGNFEAWLLVRGIRTLPLRIERMCENAEKISQFLSMHSQVEQVLYPGIKSHQDHELAKAQMSGKFGFLMSFMVKGSKQDALQVFGNLNLIHRATSLGGVESLIEHRHTIEPDIPDNLLRLSVGIEHVDDLISDLDQALNLVN